MPLSPVKLATKKDVLKLFMKLRQRGIVTIEMYVAKDGDEKPKGIKNVEQDALQKNLVFTQSGETYILADILRLTAKEIVDDPEIQSIKILSRDGQLFTPLEIKIESGLKDSMLLKKLAYNRILAETLLSIDWRRVSISIPECPLNRYRVVDPVLEDGFERFSLKRYVGQYGDEARHPLIPARQLNQDQIIENVALKELVTLFDNLCLDKLYLLKEKNNPRFAESIAELEKGFVELNDILQARISDISMRNRVLEAPRHEYEAIIQNNPAFFALSNDDLSNLQALDAETKSSYVKLRELALNDFFRYPALRHPIRFGIFLLVGATIGLVVFLATVFFPGLNVGESFGIIYGFGLLVGVLGTIAGKLFDDYSASKIAAIDQRHSDIEKVKSFRTTVPDPRIGIELTSNFITLKETQESLDRLKLKPKPPKELKKKLPLRLKTAAETNALLSASRLGVFTPPLKEKLRVNNETLLQPINESLEPDNSGNGHKEEMNVPNNLNSMSP